MLEAPTIFNTMTAPVRGLEDDFPNMLFILKHEPSNRFGCYSFGSVHGVACFSDKSKAEHFGHEIELPEMKALDVSFNEALDIAKERPRPISCIMLLDDMDNPKICSVR